MIKGLLLLYLFLFIIWMMLTGLETSELLAGAIVCLVLSLLMPGGARVLSSVKLSPRAIFYLLMYIITFLFELVKSNLDVARRVLNPDLPINPGVVKVRTKLRSKLGRLILANSITLTPGTLTVETRDDYFYIHWIDVTAGDINEATDAIVSRFEKYLEVIFG
ncbi:MAG: Na+/H+ antiporter subunit E [Candidatus Cloacimonetes bacterium]|nr:Na+/H+ antiporter subunit E [Candidatus Cloacimonadota bacterium]